MHDKIERKFCDACGTKIPKARLAAMPTTRVCVKCASESGDRRISEPWGTRGAWVQDRSSWKRTNI